MTWELWDGVTQGPWMENKVWPGQTAGDKPGMAYGVHTLTGVLSSRKSKFP